MKNSSSIERRVIAGFMVETTSLETLIKLTKICLVEPQGLAYDDPP